MCGARGIDRLLRGRQGLSQHLSAEHVFGADVAALAAEQVVLQPFELQQFDQLVHVRLGHGHGNPRKKKRDYTGAYCVTSRWNVTASPAGASAARKSPASNAWP